MLVGTGQHFPLMGRCVHVFNQSTKKDVGILTLCPVLGTQRWVEQCVGLPGMQVTSLPGWAEPALSGGREDADFFLLLLPW